MAVVAVCTMASHLRDPYLQAYSPLIPGYGALVSSARPGVSLLMREGEGSRGFHGFGKKPTGFWSQREWGTSPSHIFTYGEI